MSLGYLFTSILQSLTPTLQESWHEDYYDRLGRQQKQWLAVWIPFPHQTNDPLRWKTRPGMSEDTYPCSCPLGSLCFNLSRHCWRLRDRHVWFPDSKTMLFITKKYRVGMGIFFVHKSSKFYIAFRSGSRIFLGGGELVSCSASPPINHIVFFFAEYQLY